MSKQHVTTRARRTPAPVATQGSGLGLRRNLVEADILERSAELFAARGFAATSMQDIAGALGVSRPSLYHYFDSKEAIMLRLVEGLAASTEAAIAGVLKTDTPPDRKLRALVTALIAPIAESPGRFRLLLTSDASVGLSGTGRLRNLERAVVRSIASVIADGVEAGLFRRVDQHAATFSVLGMINWIAWWYPAGKALPIDELCVTIADLALASLRANDAHGGGESPHEILAGIRRDLGHLERALDAPETGK